MEIHDRSFRLFSAQKRKDWKEGTLVVRWLFVTERHTSNLFCLDGKVAERANFETISGSKVGYLLGEVPLPRSYVVPLLPRRASHCSLVSLTVRKFFLKILLSSVVYRWRFIRGDESDDEAKGGWIDASRVPEGGFYPLRGSSVDFLLETIPSLKNEPSNESRWNAISNGIFDSRSF